MTSKGANEKMRDQAATPRRSRRLRHSLLTLLVAACAALGLGTFGTASASAAFGLENFDVQFTNEDGTPATQAGSHPFAMTTTLGLNYSGGFFEWKLDAEMKDLLLEQIAGLVGDSTAMPQCSTADFLTPFEGTALIKCPDDTAVGVTAVNLIAPAPFFYLNAPVYNLVPPPGVAAKFGFNILNEKVTVDVGVKQGGEYNLTASTLNFPQPLVIFGDTLQLWGDPTNAAHDNIRSVCVGSDFATLSEGKLNFAAGSTGDCPVQRTGRAFLTLPRSCTGPAATHYALDPWVEPGVWAEGSVLTHDGAEPPNPQGFTGCGKLGFKPSISAKPTTLAAQSPTGLDFSLDVSDEGLTNARGLAQSDIKKAVVTLPEGMTANPSLAEGLETCTEADLARETLNSELGAGCPNGSKIGTVELESKLVDEPIKGSLFIASQNENPFHSLLAMYIVLKNPTLGIIVKQAANVERNPSTGQLTTVVDNIPQLPFSHFKLHFREGARSPLASPPACGSYDVRAELTPWSGGPPLITTSTFKVISGANKSACPSGGTPPFHPGLQAGTINNAAGQYSPFNVRLTRNDGEQEFTRFSIKLPPGIIGKLAGIPFCPDAAIEAAKSRTGTAELSSPSCSSASEIGHTLVGAGVGPSLTYAPGKVYLAGPYHGSALSIAAITAVKVGPFDLGTVVVREALKINPETAEVFIDAANSDPIPHIIDGIVTHARDIQVYVDRPEFVLNPTNCERTSTASTLLGSGLNFASELDDEPVTVTSPFQAASCASLGFKPKLALSLKGGTKRGRTPRFKAVLTARKGDANIGAAQVTLPHSEFLEQGHIGTVCTRVQFSQGVRPGENCPPASVYGHAKAITPLLDEPIEGPVFLRSSSHTLPDLVAALHSGKIDINLVGRIDSVKGGRIRNTFEEVPDAPVTRFVLEMQGGKKGLLVNSVDLCNSTNRAISHFTGQNGKVYDTKPVLKASCGKLSKKHRK
jgi:hypothetical protein